MLHAYSPPDVTKCFDGRHILFVGDSTVRQVFCKFYSGMLACAMMLM